MEGLQVRLFGDVSIRQGDQPVSLLSGKALELFCYLLIHRDRAHTRDTLSEVLWPGVKSVVAKKYLRQALWRFNAVQGQPDRRRTKTEPPLIIDLDWVRINPRASWWLDVSAFERAYLTVRDTAGQMLSDDRASDLEAALDLYRGDLLATWSHDWCSYERDRLQLSYLAMLDQLMGYCETRRLYAKGVSLGQTALRYDPARECTHRQLMRLHYLAGDRTSAIRQYERCGSAMAQEFGIRPSAGTVALYGQIRIDRVIDIAPKPAVAGRPMAERSDAAALEDLHLRLDQIQASLFELQESVQHDGGARPRPDRKARDGSPANAAELR